MRSDDRDRLLPTGRFLLVAGWVAFALASLSVLDMVRPHASDGVVLEADQPGRIVVREVIPGSGAARAGIEPGDQILGIGRRVLKLPDEAAELLGPRNIGERVPYLIEAEGRRFEVQVELGEQRLVNSSYVIACVLGLAFFSVGLFVFRSRPELLPNQLFFALSLLFFLFLVCRLRPASYSRIDDLVLNTGTLALLALPGTFLHFFLIFPRPLWRRSAGWLSQPRLRNAFLAVLYSLPLVSFAGALWAARETKDSLDLASGLPTSTWWALGTYLAAGLLALAWNSTTLRRANERRGALTVLIGVIFGLVPFLSTAFLDPGALHTGRRFVLLAVLPLSLFPVTFAVAIIRFHLLDIRVILRKSLLYTTTTAAITVVYAFGIALFDRFFRSTDLAESVGFPIVLALAIVLGFEPLRRRLQGPVDRFFQAERQQVEAAMEELNTALAGEIDLSRVVRSLVEQLPDRLGLGFAALYLHRGENRVEKAAGPAALPARLDELAALGVLLAERGRLLSLLELETIAQRDADLAAVVRKLDQAGVESVFPLASARRWLGWILLSGKRGQISLDRPEIDALQRLFRQAAIGLENGLLVEERTRQAELAREIEIASQIQIDLLPERLDLGPGWQVEALCQPAREVGGDFFLQLPNVGPQGFALAYGDVSGKSVPGALMMMAAQEVLHSLALVETDPERVLALANRRLYQIQQRGFVALGLIYRVDGARLRYFLAGQPPLLIRRASGRVETPELPHYRFPLGALRQADYRALEIELAAGDLVLAFSDGVVEAMGPNEELFGYERLQEVLESTPGDPSLVVDEVLATVAEFSLGEANYDDITLIAISRTSE